MEKQQNNKVVIVLLVIIIVILSALCVLFATGTISFNSNNVNDNKTNENDNQNEETNLTKENATTIVKEVMDKFYTEVFFGHKETYCGEYDSNDFVVNGANTYYKSTSYSNLADLKKYLNTYISSDLVNKMLDGNTVPKYQEKDNKLYCLVLARGGLTYDKDNTSYNILNVTNTKISATANVFAYAEGQRPNNISVTLELTKVNNDWVLSLYEEK